jgi:hypothetical protein
MTVRAPPLINTFALTRDVREGARQPLALRPRLPAEFRRRHGPQVRGPGARRAPPRPAHAWASPPPCERLAQLLGGPKTSAALHTMNPLCYRLLACKHAPRLAVLPKSRNIAQNHALPALHLCPPPLNACTWPGLCSKLSWFLPRHTPDERQRLLQSCLGQRLLTSGSEGAV